MKGEDCNLSTEFEELKSCSLQILAVDDEPLILMTLVDMLEGLGHHVTSSHSGKIALEMLRAQRFDVLLTDLSMPQMTGDKLIEEAKEIDPLINIILSTGFSELPAGLKFQVVKLAKPYTDESISTALKTVLERE